MIYRPQRRPLPSLSFDRIDILRLSEQLAMEDRLVKMREICDRLGRDEIDERLQTHIRNEPHRT